MANELKTVFSLSAIKGNVNYTIPSFQTSTDWTGTHYSSNVQDIGTSHEVLELGANIGTASFSYMRNLDPTNYLEIGLVVSATFYPLVKLKAGQFAFFPLAISSNIYAKANTASCSLQYVVLET